MDREGYLNYIYKTLSRNFKLEKNKNIFQNNFDFYGSWSMEYGRTFFGKENIIDKYNCGEYCLIKSLPEIKKESFQIFIESLKKATIELVKVNSEHKSSYVTGIFIVDSLEDEKIKKYIKKFSYVKNYKFSFWGFSEIRIIIVDILGQKIYSNKAAEPFVKNLYFNK
ncbi:MAG: hypothetical protein ACRDD2_14180 [Sarcina sp.]